MINKEKQDEIEFVIKHYQVGHFNANDAWKKMNRDKNSSSRNTFSYRKFIIAATVALIIAISGALAMIVTNTKKNIPVTAESTIGNTQTLQKTDSTIVFKFKDEPINKVLKQLSSYYGKRLTTNDTTKHVTGELEIHSLEEATNILETTLQIQIEVQ